MTAIRLAVCVMFGLGAHITYMPTMALGDRWGNMIRYIIGILIMWPALLIMAHDERDLTKAWALAAGGVGLGVLVGHLWDRWREEAE